MPSLILLKSPGGASPGQQYPLSGGTAFVVGRDADQCQVVIPNGSVSRKHAVITAASGRYMIEDFGSRNGTYVNQARISGPTSLKSDDRIKICDFLFRFFDESAPPVETTSAGDADSQVVDPADEPATVRTTFDQSKAREFLDAAPADRLRALLEVSTSLSRTLELEPLLPGIADALFQVFRQADRCFVILVDADGRPVTKVAKSLRASPRGDVPQFSRTIVRRCLESLQSYLTEDATADAALGTSQSIAEFRIRSAMCVPLVGGEGKALGAIQLDAQDLAKKFKDDDLKLLTIVANVAAVAVEKAHALADLVVRERALHEVEIAREVQSGFLPKSFPHCPGYEFYAFYSPAQSVGGDYYDFILLPGGRVAVVLGDVAGKGVAAALLMAKLSAEVRFSLLTEPDPARAITLLNDQLIGGIGDRFVTLAAAVLDPAKHEVTIVNAGHINPSRLSPAGTFEDAVPDDEGGLPLGAVPGCVYSSRTTRLAPGDTLVLYTDGVTDAENPAGQRFNTAGVKAAVGKASARRPAAVGAAVVGAVQAHAAGRTQSDDIAVVCFGRSADDAPPPPTDPGRPSLLNTPTQRLPRPGGTRL